MNAKFVCGASALLILLACQVRSQEPQPAKLVPFFLLPAAEQEKQPDKDKKQPDKDKTNPEKKSTPAPQTDIFARPTNDLNQVLPGFTPNMMGWVPPIDFTNRTIPVTGLQTTTVRTTTITENSAGPPLKTTTTTTTQSAVTLSRTFQEAIASRGSFAIADNESPLPQDRVYMTYNYFSDVRSPQPTLNSSRTFTTTTTAGNSTTTTTTVLPGAPSFNVNQEVFGFEKTFLDGNASVEIRVPVLQQPSSFPGFDQFDTGDLTIIGKYAFYLDRSTGNVISGGVAVTAPTGPAIPTTQGNLRDTLVQPFVGYLWNFDRLFVQAFHSVAVPTDASDVTILFNDFGLGYRLYQGGDTSRFLNSIVPAVEFHVATPLNHRGAVNDPLYVPDIAGLTAGVHFNIFRNGTLSVGATTPVTAPRIYGVEGFVQMNWRF